MKKLIPVPNLPYWQEYPERDTEWVRQYPTKYRPVSPQEIWTKQQAAIYLHIPFCNNVCVSCPYTKHRTRGKQLHQYYDSVLQEIELYSKQPYIQDLDFNIGFMGGGTPTALSGDRLSTLIGTIRKSFGIDTFEELSIESTPNDITEKKTKQLLDAGVNRMSLGVQTFIDDELHAIGRVYDTDLILKNLEGVRRAGMEWLNIDLMYGLPGQTEESFQYSLETAVALGIPNISFYAYISFATATRRKRNAIPDTPEEEKRNAMFMQAVDYLTSQGYVGYFGDLFAKPDSIPLYGPKVWTQSLPVIPLGPSATGRVRNHWYFNEPNLSDYAERIAANEFPIAMGQHISAEEDMRRTMVLGIKACRVERTEFISQYGIDFASLFSEEIADLESKGLVRLTEEALELTQPKGWYYQDNVSKYFYSAEYKRHPQHIGGNISKWMEGV